MIRFQAPQPRRTQMWNWLKRRMLRDKRNEHDAMERYFRFLRIQIGRSAAEQISDRAMRDKLIEQLNELENQLREGM